MARYQLTLAYDGTDFFGSQRQAKKRTVQGELEKALHGLGWADRSVLLSGRTDTGVHATGQVAACDLDWTHTGGELVRALNAKLPGDISVWDARIVRDDFHPRFDATSRTYSYQLFCDALRNPIRERFAWRVNHALDDELLKQVSRALIGAHDFSSFGSATTPKGTTVRTVKKAQWHRIAKDQWRFDVEADAFVSHGAPGWSLCRSLWDRGSSARTRSPKVWRGRLGSGSEARFRLVSLPRMG
ncbi:MAG: tRNA pseudouridine synthase A [Anaerolineales bacterium]